jgi:Carboxypeptidase regulatory-like domain
MMSFRKSLIAGLVCFLPLSPGSRGQSAAPPPQAAPAGPATASAQVSTGGTKVHGTITDPDGELIPGATVTFTPAKGPGRSVKSGSDGTYNITIAPGSYTMLVSMPGFASYLMTNLKVPALPSTTLDAKLKIGEETTVVNVEASAVQLSVDPDSNASSTILQGKDLEALSDDPDELQSELTALAGPAAGPNGGQIYVDGFTGGQLPPKSSIREIRINQNPFSAEYDRLGFGRVEVFTKPGTDKLHGNLQVNGNPSEFNSTNPLATVTEPPYHTVFLFGNLTGPLSKVASYNLGGSFRQIQDDELVNTYILANPATPATLCNPGDSTCVKTSYEYSSYYPQTRGDFAPRLDLALGEKNVVTMRYQFVLNDATNAQIGNTSLPEYGTNTSAMSNIVQLSDTQTWSSKLINETRFEYEREHTAYDPASTAPTVSVSGLFTSGGNSNQAESDHQDHWELQNYTSLQLKKNFIRFGGRLRTNREAQSPLQNTNGSFTYASQSDYVADTPSQFSLIVVNQPSLEYEVSDLGLYAETDWKPVQNFTLSYGVRYETQNHIRDHHDFAPRVSFAYGLFGKKSAPKTVVRGGFGMFYDRFTGTYILNLLRYNGTSTFAYTLSQVPNDCSPIEANFKQTCIAGQTTETQETWVTAPNLRTAETYQEAFGFDQQVTRVGSLSVNYLHSQGVHQLATQNIAYPMGIPVGEAPPEPVPAHNQYFSEGGFRQDQLIVNGRVSTGKHVSLFGYYSLNFAKGNTSGNGSDISTPYDINADYGRTTFDVRNRAFIAGSISLPKFIQLSPFIIAQSGNPYNIVSGYDLNGDTFFNDRPYKVTGVTPDGQNVKAIPGCGTFAQPGYEPANSPIAPINDCTGPSLFTFNFRLTKTWGFGQSRNAQAAQSGQGQGSGQHRGGGPGGGGPGRGGPGGGPGGLFGGGSSSTGKRYNFALGVQVQNLFNNRDLATPNGTLSAPNFGETTQLSGGPYTTNAAVRRIALQASFNF